MTDVSGIEKDIEKMKMKRNLSMIVGIDLKWSVYVYRIAGKTKRILLLLKITFENILPVENSVCSLARLHLNYDVQA